MVLGEITMLSKIEPSFSENLSLVNVEMDAECTINMNGCNLDGRRQLVVP